MKRPSQQRLDVLADNVRTLSRILTRDRDRLPAPYLRDPGLRQAYLAYFLPANRPKITVPLSEIAAHGAGLLNRDRLQVLDIGAGPGTSILGALDYFTTREDRPFLEFTAVEAVQESLREAKALIEEQAARYPGGATLRTVHCRAEEAVARIRQRFDLVVLSNVLNELFSEEENTVQRRADLVGEVMRALLDEHGNCIVIEPALRETSRDLLQVRDRLLEQGFQIYAPCLVQSSCPALGNPKDWCHEDRAWTPDETIRAIDERIGLRKDALKFSYLVLRKDDRSLVDRTGPRSLRVVSEPLISKGKQEYYVCGPLGRKLVVRLDRDRTPSNELFGMLQRGDVVRFEDLQEEERRVRVVKETIVTKVTVGKRRGAIAG